MGYVTLKYSVMEDKDTGNASTNQNKSFVGNSPIRLTLKDGKEYVFGPNTATTLPDFLGDEAASIDARLVVINRS